MPLLEKVRKRYTRWVMRADFFQKMQIVIVPARKALILAITLTYSLSFGSTTLAQEVVPEPNPTTTTVVQKPSILNAVKRAKVMLNGELAERRAKGKGRETVGSKPAWVDVTLAVWERDTDVITLVEIMKSGTKIKPVTPNTWPIRVDYDAKINSQYSLPPEKNAVVVGVRYPIVITRQVTKKKKVYDISDEVFVPYSSAFFVPEVLAAGSDYLSFLIQGAFDELRERRVMSHAYPGKLVVDAIDPYLIKSIVVIEHTDHRSLLKQDDPEHTLGVFLAKLALNGDDAFDGSKSNAGALGLAQFIPSTYRLFVKNRPDLALIPDFTTGMNDHQNAVKAEVAYLDESLAEMPTAVRDITVNDKMKAAEFLAAAYNGGSTRVKRAYNAYGVDWAGDRSGALSALQAKATRLHSDIVYRKKLIKKGKEVAANKKMVAKEQRDYDSAVVQIAALKKSSLRQETVFYVAKLKKTYSMFTSGVFATPAAPSGALPTQTVAAAQ